MSSAARRGPMMPVIGLEKAKPGSEGTMTSCPSVASGSSRRSNSRNEPGPAVQKKKRRLGAIAPYMDEVYSLTLDLGREVGKLVEAVFDLAPIVGISPV